jgi:flagellin-like hook-associated protein FlgL
LDIRGLVNHAAQRGRQQRRELRADQLQIDSIIEAIDRIANTTQFGGQKLINGNYEYTVSGLAASAIDTLTVFGARVPQNSFQNITVEVTKAAETAQVAFSAGSGLTENVTIEVKGSRGMEVISLTSGSTATTIAEAINKSSYMTGVIRDFERRVVMRATAILGLDASFRSSRSMAASLSAPAPRLQTPSSKPAC